MGEQTDPHFWCYYFENYAFKYLLSQCTARYAPLQVAAPALNVLRDHDRAHSTELLKTLQETKKPV